MDPNWIMAIGSLASILMSGLAIYDSKQARSQTKNLENWETTLRLAISQSQAQLLKDLSSTFVNVQVYDLQVKALHEKSDDLDHRISRNIDQTTLLMEAALRAGFPARKPSLEP